MQAPTTHACSLYLQAKVARSSASTQILRMTSTFGRFRCALSKSTAQFTCCATARASLASGSRSGEAPRRARLQRFAAPDTCCGASTWERSKEEWEWVLGVNLWGAINTIRHFVPRMVAQNTK